MLKLSGKQYHWRFWDTVKTQDAAGVQSVKRGPLDEGMIEDADTRHEQFTEEADRWHDEER